MSPSKKTLSLLTFTDQTKNWYVFFTCVVPIFVIAYFLANGAPFADWQSGELWVYAELFVAGSSLWLFLPFFGFSILSMIMLYRDYQKNRQKPWVRLGILTGFLLALKYLVLGYIAFNLNNIGAPLVPAVLLLVPILPYYLSHLAARLLFSRMTWILITGLVSIGLALLFGITNLIQSLIGFVFIGGILGSPVWASLFAGALSWQLITDGRIKNWRGMVPSSGIYVLVYGSGLYLAVQKMLEEYNKLPTEQPSCFVVTAAAKGHPVFVGSWTVVNQEGAPVAVTRQLQYAKFFEFTLKAASPRFHGFLRKKYNKIGPKIASKIQSPFIADVVYLGLKPLEWIGKVLILFAPRLRQKVEKLYLK